MAAFDALENPRVAAYNRRENGRRGRHCGPFAGRRVHSNVARSRQPAPGPALTRSSDLRPSRVRLQDIPSGYIPGLSTRGAARGGRFRTFHETMAMNVHTSGCPTALGSLNTRFPEGRPQARSNANKGVLHGLHAAWAAPRGTTWAAKVRVTVGARAPPPPSVSTNVLIEVHILGFRALRRGRGHRRGGAIDN